MSDGLTWTLIVLWGLVALGMAVGAAWTLDYEDRPAERRAAARQMFLAPIWPAAAVYVLARDAVHGIRGLWRETGWGRARAGR